MIASLGMFDVKGLTDSSPSFALGSPVFDKITIQLNNRYYKGKEFVIEAKNNSKENVYVQQYRLNGEVYPATRIPFETITAGGRLEMDMDNQATDTY